MAPDRPGSQLAGPRRVIGRADRAQPLPLSGGQQQMWFLHQLDPASPAYLMTWVLRLSGRLDTESLRWAWEMVAGRHEILRTRYGLATDGATVPIIDPSGRFELRTIDLTGELPGRQEKRAQQVAEWERTRPFDLTAHHPVRVTVLVLGPERHVVVINIHHIACDPVSYQRIARELSAFYTEHSGGAPAGLAEDTLQYADFAAWERAGQTNGTLGSHLAYWRHALAGLTELPLPLDRPRPVRPDWRGGTVDIDIKPEHAEAIAALAAKHRTSLYTVMLAVYHLMLAHLSRSADVAVGIPVSARTGPELDDLVGYLVNTVVIRSQQNGCHSFADLLAQIRERLLDALDHRAVPFAWVVDALNPQRGTGMNPLFRVGFDMDPAEKPAFQLPSIQTEEIGLSGSPPAKFDLTLHVQETPGQALYARLEFAVAVIDEETARAWASCYETLLGIVIKDPTGPLTRIGQRLRDGGAQPKQPGPGAQTAPARALHDPALAMGNGSGAPAPLIARIHQAWCEVLPTDVIDLWDNFFDVGGDSLRAVALAGRLRANGLDVSAADIFAYQTIGDLAQACEVQRGKSGKPGSPTTVAPFALVSPEDLARLPPGLVDAYPLAAMQLGMIIEMRARPDINSYQDSTSYRIRDAADLDPAALQQAVQLVVDRHEVLRTTFDLASYSVPLQLVHREAAITVRTHDYGVLGPAGWTPALTEHAAQERRSRMDLMCAPLIRVCAHTATDSAHWWITITECHPILEGWSFHTMLMEILTGYRELRAGRVPAEPEPVGFRYADYIAAEAEARRSVQDRGYWRGVIEGRVNVLLPSAWRDDPGTPRERYQDMVDYRDLDADLRRLAAQTRTSVKAVLLAAHLKVMSMIAGTEDFFTGLVCDARPEVAGADQVLGMYLNTVPFAMPASARTWGELVRAVYDGLTGMWPHRVFPLQVLQQELGSGSRLLDVFFNYLDFHQVDSDLVDEDQVLNDNDNEFALHVFTISGVVRLNTTNHRLNRAAAVRLAALYRTVLEEMSLGPDGDAGSACLPPGELARVRSLAPNRETGHDPETVLESFARTVRTHPGTPVAYRGGESLTYGQLDGWARAIAHRLIACGVRPASVVAVIPQRDLGTLAALLAIWMTGAAWTLTEPGVLAARLREPGRYPRVSAVVTAVAAGAVGLDRGAAPVVVARDAEPSNPVAAISATAPRPADDACVLPNGAVFSHGALAAALAGMRAGIDALGLGPTRGSSWLCAAPLTCGAALSELLLPVTCAGRVVITASTWPDAADETMKLAAAGAVSHLHSTPAMAERLLAGGLAAGITVLAGGDHPATSALPAGAGDHGRLIRLVEVDELVGCVALGGKPAGGLEVRVADASLRPLAVGVAGELCVSGVGLADRFHADPAYTAERFVPDPLSRSGSRMYRTGQLARFTSDGTLEHLGPIPPGAPGGGRLAELYRTRELLSAQPSALDSFVLLRSGAPHGKQLTGYIRTVPGAALDEDEVRRALARGWLPQPLIPDVLIQVNEWPLDERGAIDADRLPEPGEAPDQVATAQAPWDELFGTLLRRALDRVGYQGELAPDEPLSNSGLDSFGTVGLLLAIEQAYDIAIPDDLQITEIVRTPRTLWETVTALGPEPLTG